jgi:hypothetical protein
MLPSGVVFLNETAFPLTDARTRALLDYSTVSCLTTLVIDLISPRATRDLIYLKNSLMSERFSNNKLMEIVKTWLSS